MAYEDGKVMELCERIAGLEKINAAHENTVMEYGKRIKELETQNRKTEQQLKDLRKALVAGGCLAVGGGSAE